MVTPLRLICDDPKSELEVITEQKNIHERASKFIRGPYIVAEQENANKRKYSRPVMEKAVLDYTKEFIMNSRAMGELNHPNNTDVNLENACHVLTELRQDNNVWIGKSKVLTGTPKGDILASLLDNGIKVGMSTRGVGHIDESNNVVDDFKLIAVDCVANPSAPGAFVEGILESKFYMINEYGTIVEMAYNRLENSLKKLPMVVEEKNDQIIEAVRQFIKAV